MAGENDRRPAASPDEHFLTHAAHQLRGSLNMILGWAEYLRAPHCDERGRVRAADIIVRQARQQAWMIAELLDQWRLRGGLLRLNRTLVDLRALVESSAEAVRPIAEPKRVHLGVQTDAGAGPFVVADAERLGTVLTTLFANAAHFAPDSSVVEARLTSSDAQALVTLHDTGAGITPAALAHLFDRHRPRDAAEASPRAEFRLGLSFARAIVEMHGGSLVAVSRHAEQGVTFRIALPLAEAHRAGTAAVADDTRPRRASAGGSETTEWRWRHGGSGLSSASTGFAPECSDTKHPGRFGRFVSTRPGRGCHSSTKRA